MNNTIKAIAFDLDGVIVDASFIHFKSLNITLEKHHLRVISKPEHETIFDGLSTKEKLKILQTSPLLSPQKIQEINNDKQIATLDAIRNYNFSPEPITSTLKYLKKLNYQIACCSNSSRESLDLILKKLDIDSYFDFSLSNGDVDHPKPSPDIYLKALHNFNCKPQECLIIEDNENGFLAATKAQAHLLKVSCPQDVTFNLIDETIELINSGER
jgi:HAD superfamily hydrolase (TIGR01509 family)